MDNNQICLTIGQIEALIYLRLMSSNKVSGVNDIFFQKDNKYLLPIDMTNVSAKQCDQIGRFIGLWATFKAFGNN